MTKKQKRVTTGVGALVLIGGIVGVAFLGKKPVTTETTSAADTSTYVETTGANETSTATTNADPTQYVPSPTQKVK